MAIVGSLSISFLKRVCEVSIGGLIVLWLLGIPLRRRLNWSSWVSGRLERYSGE